MSRIATVTTSIAFKAELLPRAIALADGLASKAHPVMKRLKGDLYPHVLTALRARQALEGEGGG
jgi:hypothetical protein